MRQVGSPLASPLIAVRVALLLLVTIGAALATRGAPRVGGADPASLATPASTPRVGDHTPFASVLATILVGAAPSAVAVDPELGRVFVGCEGSSGVDVIDERTLREVQHIALGAAPAALAVAARADRLLVALAKVDRLAVVRADTGQVVGTAPGLFVVAGLAVDDSAGLAYVGGETEDRYGVENGVVAVLALDTLAPSGTHQIGARGAAVDALAIDQPASRLLVAYAQNSSTPGLISVFDVRSWRQVDGYSGFGGQYAGTAFGAFGAFGLAADPATHAALVSSITHGPPLWILRPQAGGDLAGAEVQGSLGGGPAGVAIDAGTGTGYVANSGDFAGPPGAAGSVSVVDEASGSVVATVPVGVEPWGIAVDPATHLVFVANKGSNTVSVIAGRR